MHLIACAPFFLSEKIHTKYSSKSELIYDDKRSHLKGRHAVIVMFMEASASRWLGGGDIQVFLEGYYGHCLTSMESLFGQLLYGRIVSSKEGNIRKI